jgi:hypothetical protein
MNSRKVPQTLNLICDERKYWLLTPHQDFMIKHPIVKLYETEANEMYKVMKREFVLVFRHGLR